jgi:hypothetical protein
MGRGVGHEAFRLVDPTRPNPMNAELPIGTLIAARQAELRLTPGQFVRRGGYRSTDGGLRRLSDLCHGDLSSRTRFLLDALPYALDLPATEVKAAVLATMEQIAEAQRARAEAEEQAYRVAFRPHVLWMTEHSRPTSITMAAFAGIERLLRFDLDLNQGEETFVAQAIAAMPAGVAFFGETRGFSVSYSPDRCVEYDAQGNVVATFPRARRPGWADVTLKNGRSILPLFGVELPGPLAVVKSGD